MKEYSLDFNRLNSRPKLQGRDVVLKQVYEIETVMIESTERSLSSIVIQDIIKSIHEDIFKWKVVSKKNILIEFTHADALRQWLSNRDRIKERFNVNIQLKIQYIDEFGANNIATSSPTTSMIESKANDITAQVTINLPRSWAIVVGHAKFGAEYKDFIRKSSHLFHTKFDQTSVSFNSIGNWNHC